MSEESVDLNLLSAEGSQAVLERTLIAEYLLGKGYLMSDLKELPPQAAKSLMGEASRFAARRLAEFEFIERFQIRLPFSLN
jgi:superfamily I DNA and/or RNA helicase